MVRYRRISLLAGMLVLLTATVSASDFYAPRIDGIPAANTPINISVENGTAFTDPRLRYRALDAPDWNTCTLTNYTCQLPDGLEQAVYEYYFINGTDQSTRFPQDSTLKLAVSSGNTRWKNMGRNFTDTDPTNDGFSDSCAPWENDFSCGFEDMQGAMIHSFRSAATMTDNQTYHKKADNLSLSEYDTSSSSAYATCDISDSDYDCDTDSNTNPRDEDTVTGARRQAFLIHALSATGRMLNLSQVRAEGANYMEGSAETCDIWADAFDCGSATDQGLMTGAAWAAYIAHGDDTYRGKAVNLTDVAVQKADTVLNQSTVAHVPALTQGLWRAYEVTGNDTYREKAANLTVAAGTRCANVSGVSPCSVENQSMSILSALDGYRVTGKNVYFHVANRTLHTEFAGSCNPWNNTYACSRAHDQGLAAHAYWSAYRTLPVTAPRFYRPRIRGTRENGEPLTFTVGIRGDPTDPALYIRKLSASTWNRCSLHRSNQSCTVGGDTLTQQTVYEYRFNASETALPRSSNGTFKLLLASRNDSTRAKAVNLTHGTENFCDPWAGNISNGDYTCRFTHWQGWMIQGFLDGAVNERNETYETHADMLGIANYSPLDSTDSGNQFACDHADDDFDCNPASGDAPNGSVRQGRIISGLWDTYMETGNASVRVMAENYTRGSANDCDVWSNDFDCDSETGQGHMIAGYLAAYRGTGNQTYLETAENLSDDAYADGSINDSTLLGSMWDAYSVTGNASYQELAENDTDDLLDRCTDGSCDTVEYAQTFDAGITGHSATGNTSYYDTAYQVLEAGNNGTCDAWENDVTCTDADEQGTMISTFWNAYAYDQVAVDGDLTIDAAAGTVTVDEDVDVSCTVTNTVANSTLFDVNLSITASAFSIGGNTSVTFTNITADSSENHTWTLTASNAGDADVTCDAASSNGWSASTTTTITVEDDTDETTDTSDDSTSTDTSTSSPPVFTPEHTYEQYDFTHQDTESELHALVQRFDRFNRSLQQLLNTTAYGASYTRQYTVNRSTCLSGWRNHTQYESSQASWLNVTYSCPDRIAALAVRDDIDTRFATNSTTTARHTGAVQQQSTVQTVFHDITDGDTVHVRYTANGSGNLSMFDPPLVLLRPAQIPTPDRTAPNISVTGVNATNRSAADRITLAVTDESESDCTVVKENGSQRTTIATFQSGAPFTYRFTTGWNNLTITCVDDNGNTATEQVTVLNAEADDTQDRRLSRQQVSFIIGGVLVLSAGALVYRYRKRLLQVVRERWLHWHLGRMETYLQNGRPERAIRTYQRIASWYRWRHGDVPDARFWQSRIGSLGTVLELYILLDIAEQYARRGETAPVSESWEALDRLVTRFLERHPDSPARPLLLKKAATLEHVTEQQ